MIRWTEPNKTRFAAMYSEGASEASLFAALPGLTHGAISGQSRRMQMHRPLAPERVRGLPADHPAAVDGRTMFPTRIRDPGDAPNVLVPGAWQRKLGSIVTKGAWAGFPIFALTLEERATCPRECHNWFSCMGNGMQAAWRNRHGAELEAKLGRELAALQLAHPGGFVVRLHVLGDFYSEAYLAKWSGWLDQFPALHVFGYTAWDWLSPIGSAIAVLAFQHWDRFAVRLSSREPGTMRAVTLWQVPSKTDGFRRGSTIVCPVQLGKTACCGSCALCWSPAARTKTIGFVAHGPAWAGRPVA